MYGRIESGILNNTKIGNNVTRNHMRVLVNYNHIKLNSSIYFL